jgi:hypothetical protein
MKLLKNLLAVVLAVQSVHAVCPKLCTCTVIASGVASVFPVTACAQASASASNTICAVTGATIAAFRTWCSDSNKRTDRDVFCAQF